MNMQEKFYQLYGVDVAIKLLRPGARWEICNGKFTVWEDERPCPPWEEVQETLAKIKAFEDSLNTIWTPQQIAELKAKGSV